MRPFNPTIETIECRPIYEPHEEFYNHWDRAFFDCEISAEDDHAGVVLNACLSNLFD